jgi:hypothetical protein
MSDPPVVTFADQQWLPKPDDFADWTVVPPSGIPRTASGPCPSCGHNVKAELNYRGLGRGQAGEGAPSPEERFTTMMRCGCRQNHPDSAIPPVNHPSCGRWWLASVTLSEGTPGPRVRPNVDEALEPAAIAWDEFVKSQEPSFRTLAEKWTAAVTALLGLFGLAVFVTSKDVFTGLTPGWKLGAALSVFCALGCAVWAVYLSYRAAYGWPTFIERNSDQALVNWYSGREARLRRDACRLKASVWLAIGELGLLVAAAAVVWFAPHHTAAPSQLLCRFTATATDAGTGIYHVDASSSCPPK